MPKKKSHFDGSRGFGGDGTVSLLIPVMDTDQG
jgi:hypothetical protein